MLRRILAIAAATIAAIIAVLIFNRPAPSRQTVNAPMPASAPAPTRAVTPPSQPAPALPAESASPDTPTRRASPRREAAAPIVAAPAVAIGAATLRIDSDVPGAQVFIDREYLGTAPLTAHNIRPGSHRLNASAAGYDGVAETIDIAPGSRDLTVRFKEVRLDATLDVVHKHRFGSCRGRLIATPAGLRFESTDKGDAFTTPLPDLQTFEIDYLKKNLRIELRKGRRYDFTDPDGNADRLFVFHRDVTKARRLAADGGRP